MPQQTIREKPRTRRHVGGQDFRRKPESSGKPQNRVPAGGSPEVLGLRSAGLGEDGLCRRTVPGRPGQVGPEKGCCGPLLIAEEGWRVELGSGPLPRRRTVRRTLEMPT